MNSVVKHYFVFIYKTKNERMNLFDTYRWW